LYILGRREVFESCTELKPAFDILLKRQDTLQLVTGELWPSQRILKDEEGSDVPGQTEMVSVEHLGQYVFDMTSAKVAQLRAERGLPEAGNEIVGDVAEEDGYLDEGLDVVQEDVEGEMSEGPEVDGGGNE
jgi:intron-binding protein aquarius